MGKCTFNMVWLDDDAFKSWLKPVANNKYQAYCTLCKKTLELSSLGIKALHSHGKSERHQGSLKGLQGMQTITQFWSPSLPGPSSSRDSGFPVAVASSRPATSSATSAFGSTSTLKAEVLWVLNTVTKHQSYIGNEDISELFQAMFPDSDIAKTFMCGKDKTSYIARFGLAEFIKNDLVTTEADKLAEEAEGTSGSKMARLLLKSNALRRASKGKRSELKKVEEITVKADEHRYM